MDLEQLITSREAELSKAGQGTGWGDALQALVDWPVPAARPIAVDGAAC
jgi:hypothetical protein